MKTVDLKKPITFKWVVREDWRLDAGPYLSGKVEALLALEKLPTVRLVDLTHGHDGGIYNGPQFRRVYVDDPEQGVPFIGSSDMLLADLTRLPLLRRKDAESHQLRHLKLAEGMTLISCSGTIGRTVYCRAGMAGAWSSQDVLKVVPDPSKIPPGYLYAFLKGRFGSPLVIAGTYGAIIQHLEAGHLKDLPVPRLGNAIERKVHSLVSEAGRLQTEFSEDLFESSRQLISQIGTPRIIPDSNSRSVSSAFISKIERLDAHYYDFRAIDIDAWIDSKHPKHKTLGELAKVFDVPPFKHIYVDGDNGLPFFTSGDIFHLHKTPEKNLSSCRTKNIKKYILKSGCVLLARSGQIGGIIGQPEFADSSMNGKTASDHVIRIVPHQIPSGYLFTYLNTRSLGYWLLVRTASGTSIPALWPVDLRRIKVILLDQEKMNKIGGVTEAAFEKRVRATQLERQAVTLVEEAIQKAI